MGRVDVGGLILSWGGYIAVFGTCAALMVNYTKIRDYFASKRKAKYEKEHAVERQILEKVNGLGTHMQEIDNRLAVMQEDMIASQLNDLKQLYSNYMRQGFCTVEQREGFFSLYDRYREQKHNSLAKSFRKDIEDLPLTPPQGG